MTPRAVPARRQRGAALMIMMLIVVLGGAWWLVSGLQSRGNRTVIERSHNANVLAEAKAALIAWAANNAADPGEKYPGRLPCPEGAAWIAQPNDDRTANTEGIAAPGTQQGIAVNTCSSVGRLPWRTLGIPKLQDAAGEPLWYVVTTGASGWAFADPSTTLTINSNKGGTIIVDGTANAWLTGTAYAKDTLVVQGNIAYVALVAHTSNVFATDLAAGYWRQTDVVAAIIAPGAPMTVVPNANQTAAGCVARTQQRNPFAPDVRDYLECQSTAASPISLRTRVVDNVTNKVSNDQIVLITAAEVLAAVEPMVAQRIKTQVLPQLQGANALYASSEWSTSAANPTFPFAVTFGDPGTTPTSGFKGAAGKTEGLLPLNALTCTPITTGRCDPNYHTFNVAGISAVATANGPITSDCVTSSTTAQIQCTMSFLKLVCLLCAVPTVRVQGDAANVGLAMRTFNTAAATAPGLINTSVTAALQADGSARVTLTGNLASSGGILCGSLIGVVCTGSATVTIPISAFQDHPFINPTSANNWYWFFANNWHHVTYYAVAPLHAPGGAGNCSGATCLSVTMYGDTSLNDKRAVLVLGGRSLNGTGGTTNRALSDFLDSAENRNADLKFEQYKSNRTFNDRFVSLSP